MNSTLRWKVHCQGSRTNIATLVMGTYVSDCVIF
jgi:hypothetical protein